MAATEGEVSTGIPAESAPTGGSQPTIQDLTIEDLREELRSRGLDTSGLKYELIARLEPVLARERERASAIVEGKGEADTEGAMAQALHKLFVGQVPPGISDAQLRAVFAPYGKVVNVSMLKNTGTGQARGCAFVSYDKREEAEAAIAALNEKYQLPGAKRTMLVSFAGRPAGAAESKLAGEHKLYVGMLSRKSTEVDIRRLFEPYGIVKEVHLLTNKDSGQSKGAAFIKYTARDEALRAINALHDVVRDGDAPGTLQVRFAHTQHEKALQAQRGLPRPGQAPGMGFAFGGASGFPFYGGAAAGGATGAASPYGAMGTAPTSNPYGLPAAPSYGAASAAAAPGTGYPGSLYSPALPSPYSSTPSYLPSLPSRSSDARGPQGANIFIYNIPQSYTDADLLALFAPFGTVLSCNVQTDKLTGQHKGFGFVSYADSSSGAMAIEAMDGFVTGGKKLAVRVKKPPGGAPGSAPY